MVHQTIATRMTPATNDSNNSQPMMSVARAVRRSACVVAAFAVAACQVAPVAPTRVEPSPAVPPTAVYTPVGFGALPGWSTDATHEAWPALLAGCSALLARDDMRSTWQAPCTAAAALAEPDADSARRFFETHFTAYAIAADSGKDTGLVSGYYEPLLPGSRTRSSRYPVPLYAPPDDLLIVDLADLHPELKGKRVRGRLDGRRVVAYWPRAGIDAGAPALDGKAIAWVADPVEAFFLEIQGSGRIQLDDGTIMRVGYADQNGHPFRSIARVLIDRGEMTADTASMQAIKAWGRRNADRLPALLEENPSYVFFREIATPAPGTLEARIDGPIGSLGVPLLAQRTIAVDTRYVPLGAPVFLDTTRPLSREPLQRLTLAQDTGGAIRGIGRADFFWGFGDAAGREAGRMRQQGRMWILWPRGARLPST
jgi:membrane-bound lytic murein transglycosylase A